MVFHSIKEIHGHKDQFVVKLSNGTSFSIVRPDFSDINDTMRFQFEMLSYSIHPRVLEELMFALIIGLLFDRPIESYQYA